MRAFLRLFAVVSVGLLGISGVRAGDPKLAQTLMEAGRKALEEGDLDRAFANFQKASDEDHTNFEYQYWHGVISEKRGDNPYAVGCYRTFLGNFDNMNKLGASVPPATIPLAKKARARLEVLAAGPLEQEKLEEGLIEKLMAAANSARTTNPDAAKRAARWVQRIKRGKHEAAAALLKELGETPGKASAPPDEPAGVSNQPFVDVPAVKSGKSLLHSQVFGASPGWTWAKVAEKWVATIDSPTQGQVAWPSPAIASGGRFVYELEARILTEHKFDWAIGPAFGKRDNFVAVFFQRNQVVATRAAPGKGFVDVGGNGLEKGLDPKEWHRLTYVVDGTALKVWLDGAKVLEKEVPFAAEILENLGLWYQNCKVEVRTLRFGTLP